MIGPDRFDENEWFVLLSFAVLLGLSLGLPRRFPLAASIAFVATGVGIAIASDYLTGVAALDLYDANDSPKYEWFELLLYLLSGSFSYLFAYFIDRWRVRGWGAVLYILGWSAFGTAYEALAIRYDVFDYKGWNLGYSFVFYLFVQSVYCTLIYPRVMSQMQGASR